MDEWMSRSVSGCWCGTQYAVIDNSLIAPNIIARLLFISLIPFPFLPFVLIYHGAECGSWLLQLWDTPHRFTLPSSAQPLFSLELFIFLTRPICNYHHDFDHFIYSCWFWTTMIVTVVVAAATIKEVTHHSSMPIVARQVNNSSLFSPVLPYQWYYCIE